MTRAELVDAIAARAGIARASAEDIVTCIFDTMTDALRRDDAIEIRRFGTMTVRRYSARDGSNPRTGVKVDVAAKRSPFFRVATELREIVDSGRHSRIVRDDDDDRAR